MPLLLWIVGARDLLRGVEAKSGRMEWNVPKVGILWGRNEGSITEVRSKGDKNVFIQKITNLLYTKIYTYVLYTHIFTHACSLGEKCPPKDCL